MKRTLTALAFALTVSFAPIAGQAVAATAGTTYAFGSITATPIYYCTDQGCGIDVTGYAYQGDGTCSAQCAGWPIGPLSTSVSFSVSKVHPPSPCVMQTGTGAVSATFTGDPSGATIQGTFTFKAKDSKVVTLSGIVTSSTVAALPAGAALTGFVTHPPSPCTGGIATAQLAFGG